MLEEVIRMARDPRAARDIVRGDLEGIAPILAQRVQVMANPLHT